MSRNFELLKQLEVEVDHGLPHPLHTENEGFIAKQASSAEAVRIFGVETVHMVQTIFLSATPRSARRVVFCGVYGGSGGSTVCASAGRALTAISDKSICLVDADVRLQYLSSAFGINSAIPFPSTASVRERCAHIEGNLWLAGTNLLANDCGVLLTAAELRHRLTQLMEAFDFLLVNAPSIGVSRDAALVGEVVGAAILVVEANATRKQTARRAKESLEAAGVRLLGTVLRNRSFPIPESIYKRL